MSAGVFGIMVVRNAVDLIEINLRYHLSLGLDRILIVDNGSTDGTRAVLNRMSREDERIRWRPDDGQYHQGQMTTLLAREAYYLGAKWVMPIDADEFWHVAGTSLERILADTHAAALKVAVVNFVQRRAQRESTPWSLRYATWRAATQVGPVGDCERLVEEKQISFVEAAYPPKWLSRASATLSIGAGNHVVQGTNGPSAECGQIEILHLPLRSRSALNHKVEQGRRIVEAGFIGGDSWHQRRWWRLAQIGELEREWRANSYEGESLDVFGTLRPLVYDSRLRDALQPWLPEPPLDGGTPLASNEQWPEWGAPIPGTAMHRRTTDSPTTPPPQNAGGLTVAELEARCRASIDLLHEENRNGYGIRAELAEACDRLTEAEARWERQCRQVQETDYLEAQLEADLEQERGETQAARRDFDRLASRRLVQLSFAATVAFSSALRAAGQSRRALQLLGLFAKDAWRRLAKRPIWAAVDHPTPGTAALGTLEISGWAWSGSARVESVNALHPDGSTVLNCLQYGLERPDVLVSFPWALTSRCGFAGSVPLVDLEPGEHSIVVRIRDCAGNEQDIKRTISVIDPAEVEPRADGRFADPTVALPTDLPSGGARDRLAMPRQLRRAPGSAGLERGHTIGARVGDPNPPDALATAFLHAFLASGEQMVFPLCDEPTVSIVIPTFRQAHYVYLTLQNILMHTKGIAYELVVVDNAPGDVTRTLLDRLVNVKVALNKSNVGFARACNQGAQMARGTYVCFLNSDALPTSGWLGALVRTIESYPSCGAVGAKLVFPSGRLQEAGSVIWSDGSTVGYGRGGDPLDPQYCYVREVDYCSAACLLMPRDLFWRLDGFDERYQPAYCEDTDLCLSVWAAGYKVVYQPSSVVLHVEGGSGASAQAVALQLGNREKLVDKWRDVLAKHPSSETRNLLLARDSRAGRRVLVIDDYLPNINLGQGMPRTAAMIQSLMECGYVVTFLPVRSNQFGAAVSRLQQLGVEVLSGGARLQEELVARAGLFDAVIVSRPHNAKLMSLVKSINRAAAIVYDAEAVFAYRTISQAACEGHPLSARDAEALVASEVVQVDEADLVLVVSAQEQRTIQRYRPEREAVVWGDCVEVRKDAPGFAERSGVLFVGYLGSPPNADAVRYFITKVWPTVSSNLDSELIVVGADAPAELGELATSLAGRVRVVGFVDDLRPYYDRCRVFVAPHRFAAGLPHKVVEAVAEGIPCVVSDLLGQQLEFADGDQALIAGDPETLAQKVVQLHEDRSLWERVQAASMQVVRERYETSIAKKVLGQSVERAIEVRSGKGAGVRS